MSKFPWGTPLQWRPGADLQTTLSQKEIKAILWPAVGKGLYVMKI